MEHPVSKNLPLGLFPAAGPLEGLQTFWVPHLLEDTCIKTKGQGLTGNGDFPRVVEGLDG